MLESLPERGSQLPACCNVMVSLYILPGRMEGGGDSLAMTTRDQDEIFQSWESCESSLVIRANNLDHLDFPVRAVSRGAGVLTLII